MKCGVTKYLVPKDINTTEFLVKFHIQEPSVRIDIFTALSIIQASHKAVALKEFCDFYRSCNIVVQIVTGCYNVHISRHNSCIMGIPQCHPFNKLPHLNTSTLAFTASQGNKDCQLNIYSFQNI